MLFVLVSEDFTLIEDEKLFIFWGRNKKRNAAIPATIIMIMASI
jgi:hypothetical protein